MVKLINYKKIIAKQEKKGNKVMKSVMKKEKKDFLRGWK
jgi:hypothetical protein